MARGWTKAEIEDFRSWHDKRLAELAYPVEIETKLRNAREVWMPKERKERKNVPVR